MEQPSGQLRKRKETNEVPVGREKDENHEEKTTPTKSAQRKKQKHKNSPEAPPAKEEEHPRDEEKQQQQQQEVPKEQRQETPKEHQQTGREPLPSDQQPIRLLRLPQPSHGHYISQPDGRGGYRIIHVPQQIWKPTVWFPLSKERPFWSFNAEVNVLFWMMVVAGFLLRFWSLDFPPYVVFDEVHFGKFSSYYLTRMFFFDVHPPLCKMIFAAIGYWNGFNGSFLFSNIGDTFPMGVPYVIMRGSSALGGALLIPTIYHIMLELGFSHRPALLACFFTLLDNGLQTQSRVIMLDSLTILFTYLSILGYLKFYHCRETPYSKCWHFWLAATGIFLGCLLGVKYTGLLCLCCVGLLALCDLWQIVGDLATDKIELFTHMAYRGLYLLGIPLLINVVLFYIHFSILTQSGPGNAFVSTEFQDTLEGVPPEPIVEIPDNSTLLRYGGNISLRSSDLSCWLHSHGDLYPLKYPDDRGSSYQQQVTCYEFEDVNNYWAIRRPANPDNTSVGNDTSPLLNKDLVELVHTSTLKLLNSHDVAAPLTPANQEVAGYINYSAKFVPYLHWRIEVQDYPAEQPIFWAPGRVKFRLIHEHSGQALGSTGKRLPEWGFQQYEVVTDRAVEASHTLWTMDSFSPPPNTEEMIAEEADIRNKTLSTQTRGRRRRQPSQPKEEGAEVTEDSVIGEEEESLADEDNSTGYYPFVMKYLEMQARMLSAHGSLGDHQFGSPAYHWPLIGKTLPYWLDAENNAQVTLILNPILCWCATGSVFVFLAITGFYMLRRQRRIADISDALFLRWWTSGGVLLVGWLAHYLPYFLLSRVLFLHHYLPALPFKFMLLAAVCEHGFYWVSRSKWHPTAMFRLYTGLLVLLCLAVLWSFLIFAPFTFGYPALSKDQIDWRQWRETWDFLFRTTS